MGKYYGYIYETTNLINGKVYAGQHKVNDDKQDNSYKGSGILLRNWVDDKGVKHIGAFEKYGWDNFSCKILAWAKTENELNQLEILYVNQYKKIYGEQCYNIADGGYESPLKYKTKEELTDIYIREGQTKKINFANMSDTEYKEYCIKRKKDSNKPEVRENMSKGQKLYHDNMSLEEREKYKTFKQSVLHENREKVNSGRIKYFANMSDEEHVKRSKIQTEVANRVEVREKNSKAQLARYNKMTEDEKQAFRARQKSIANRPETKAKMKESNKKYWDNMTEVEYINFCVRRKEIAGRQESRIHNSEAKKAYYANLTDTQREKLKMQRLEIANRPNVKEKIRKKLSNKPLIITFIDGDKKEFLNTVECEKTFKGCSNGLFGQAARRGTVSERSKLFVLYKIVKVDYK